MDAVRARDPRAVDAALGCARLDGVARGRRGALQLFRCVLAVVVRAQDVHYGHTLAPTAPVKVPPFTPPVFGYQQIANFEVYSYPRGGTYLLVAAALVLFIALGLAWRAGTSRRSTGSGAVQRPGRDGDVDPSVDCRARDDGMAGDRVGGRTGRVSTLQARVDAAAPGARIEVPAGTYPGNLVIGRPVRLVGLGRPLLIGAGRRQVVTITRAGRHPGGLRHRRPREAAIWGAMRRASSPRRRAPRFGTAGSATRSSACT